MTMLRFPEPPPVRPRLLSRIWFWYQVWLATMAILIWVNVTILLVVWLLGLPVVPLIGAASPDPPERLKPYRKSLSPHEWPPPVYGRGATPSPPRYTEGKVSSFGFKRVGGQTRGSGGA